MNNQDKTLTAILQKSFSHNALKRIHIKFINPFLPGFDIGFVSSPDYTVQEDATWIDQWAFEGI